MIETRFDLARHSAESTIAREMYLHANIAILTGQIATLRERIKRIELDTIFEAERRDHA